LSNNRLVQSTTAIQQYYIRFLLGILQLAMGIGYLKIYLGISFIVNRIDLRYVEN